MLTNSLITPPSKIIGILGGMGPMAGVDMLAKFIARTNEYGKATCDQDHIPVLLSSIPDVPDRSEFLLKNGQDPYPHLLSYAKNLQNAGATCLVIACNTAHYWFDRLQADLPNLTMLSMIDTTVQSAAANGKNNIGILATNATLATGLYKDKIRGAGLHYLEPNHDDQQAVMESIYLYKAGQVDKAITLMTTQKDKLISQGADIIIMGCTEVPLILADDQRTHPQHYIDATQALVDEAIAWCYQN
ncbi:aspartate/glutamate racemase family protein [Moraxella equi]|uniref:Aspartate racemase n=1 Tax=Moraxella equi TaxID=60442 RepID=A0A378QVK6_9GAMM|nr:amino acid racemase [Moraxella equi]OPH39484.1 aspartate racemase [Moraxella equi]STZ04420.1 Aspartate racemase [Moraxella equi]